MSFCVHLYINTTTYIPSLPIYIPTLESSLYPRRRIGRSITQGEWRVCFLFNVYNTTHTYFYYPPDSVLYISSLLSMHAFKLTESFLCLSIPMRFCIYVRTNSSNISDAIIPPASSSFFSDLVIIRPNS